MRVQVAIVEVEGMSPCVDTMRERGRKILEGVGVGIFYRRGDVPGVLI